MWKKVVGPTLLVTFLWLSISGATTVYIFWLSDSNTRILEEHVSSIRAAGTMQQSLWKLQSEFLDAIADQNWTDRERQSLAVRKAEDRFLEACRFAEESSTTPEEFPVVREIRDRFAEYRNVIDGHLQGQSPVPRNQSELIDRSSRMAQNLALRCAELAQINERVMDTAVVHRSQMEHSYNFFRMGVLIAGPAIGIWVGMRIARNLDQSISQICVTLKDASGELDQKIGNVEIVPSRKSGDLSALNEQVQLISARIRQVLVELDGARQEAVLSERLAVVGELAAGVAHEIRNPLTSVKLLMQTAAPADDAGIQLKGKETQVIRQEVLRMEETIQALLDFARPPALNRVRHDLRETLQRALNLVEGRARLERVAIVPRVPGRPLLVDGDPEQLHQVFVNLLINGIDSISGGGVLQIDADLVPEAGFCRICVADCGTGIPPESMTRIFEPFVTTKPRGTGLGLAVSRRIVREHGGTIVAGNRAEGGAIFTVELQSVASGVREPGIPFPSGQRIILAAR